MITYKTLHKDVKLLPNEYGKYDRVLVNGDFVLRDGLQSLHSAITFKIMLIWNELRNNPTYMKQGNKTWGVLKENKTDLTMFTAKEYTIQALEEIRRIKKVNTLNVIENPNDPFQYIISFSVTSIDDSEISGSVTVGI
jgi:lipid A disaccharide synthetase